MSEVEFLGCARDGDEAKKHDEDDDLDLDARDVKSFTALMLAAKCVYHGVARILLKAGADIENQDSDGNTPLLLAVRHNNRDLVRLLLLRHAEIVRILLHENPDLEAEDNDANTALALAEARAGRKRRQAYWKRRAAYWETQAACRERRAADRARRAACREERQGRSDRKAGLPGPPGRCRQNARDVGGPDGGEGDVQRQV